MAKKPLSRDECVEILKIIYLRCMNLKFGYLFACAISKDQCLQNECPDICDYVQWSFAIDAYITIWSFFSNGSYLFSRLEKNDDGIANDIQVAKDKIHEIIPGFSDIRNKMFAHAIEKRDVAIVHNLFQHFESLFRAVTNLHMSCCTRLHVQAEEFGGYDEHVFEGIYDEIHRFMNIVLKGYLEFGKQRISDKYDVAEDDVKKNELK